MRVIGQWHELTGGPKGILVSKGRGMRDQVSACLEMSLMGT